MFDLIVRVASRRFEEVEPFCTTQGFEDIIDAPALIISAPVYRRVAGNQSALDGKESAIWAGLKEASDETEIGNGPGRRTRLERCAMGYHERLLESIHTADEKQCSFALVTA
jgi:hypothetical protein